MCLFWRKMCTKQDIFSIPFIIRQNHFFVRGHKQDLPHITCIFHLLKDVVKYFLVSAILHHISLTLPKSYCKISTFQPIFLCSSSLNGTIELCVCMLPGVSMIAVGVGSDIYDDELSGIASTDSQVFKVTDFASLQKIIGVLRDSICQGRKVLHK